MALTLLFTPIDAAADPRSIENRILSLAMHAYLNTLFLGEVLAKKEMTEEEATGRFVAMLTTKVMALFPADIDRADAADDTADFEVLATRLGLKLIQSPEEEIQ